MLKEFKITLYDFFGYLIPGFVLLFAISLRFYDLTNYTELYGALDCALKYWPISVLLAYLLGHFSHTVSSFIIEYLPTSYDIVFEKINSGTAYAPQDKQVDFGGWIKNSLISRIKHIVGGHTPYEINQDTLFYFADEHMLQFGNAEEREIYQYREGFYRSCICASALLSLSAFAEIMPPVLAIILCGLIPILLFCLLLFFQIKEEKEVEKKGKILEKERERSNKSKVVLFGIISVWLITMVLLELVSQKQYIYPLSLAIVSAAFAYFSWTRYLAFRVYRVKRAAVSMLLRAGKEKNRYSSCKYMQGKCATKQIPKGW